VELPNLPGLVGALFAAVPAMILLYVFLHRYDRFFDERRLLFALLVGLLAGTVATMIQILFLRFHEMSFILSQPWYLGLFQLAIIYPVLESAARLIPVNWPNYRGKRDTPYYAAGIGVGFAGIHAFMLIGRATVEFMQVWAPEMTHLQILVVALIGLVLLVGGILTHGFSTIVMGQSVVDRDPLRGFVYGAVLVIPYYVLFWVFSSIIASPMLAILVALAGFAYGAIGVAFVRRNILEKVVPPEMARKIRREMRRESAEQRVEETD
jgi:hypothetical protein